MKDGHGGVVMGSEISGNYRNVFIENCHMDSPNLHRAFRFKSNARRGGVVENVGSKSFRNITIEPAKKEPTRNSRTSWP
jgi:polygalacturonase